MDELKNLELINLTSKISKELFNFTGLKDKVWLDFYSYYMFTDAAA